MKAAGFTLLEVLVALTVLSLTGLVVIRACGDSLTQVAESGWRDTAIRLGRAKMLALVREGISGNSRGTFAPEQPQLTWQARLTSVPDREGRRLEFIVREAGKEHEVVLEQILFP